MVAQSMFRLPSLPASGKVLALVVSALLFAAANAQAESAYTPVLKRDNSFEISERGPRSSKWSRIWKWSAAALVAGSTMDVASSYGYAEANGMLRSGSGQLQARGTAIKFGVLGAALVGQHYLRQRHPEMEKPLAITNFAVGAAYSGVAVRNWRVR